MTQPIFINGRFLSQRTTGVQRVAREVVAHLDELAGDDRRSRWTLLTPRTVTERLSLSHIEQRAVGFGAGHVWEQIELPMAARGGVLLSLGNTGPLVHDRQVVMIHDAAVFAVPEAYTWLFTTWTRFVIRHLGRRCAGVVTPSEFSRDELAKHAGLAPERVTVAPLGVEHVRAHESDPSLLEAHGLVDRRYVLAVGSAAAHKNLAAVLAIAGALGDRDVTLAIVGGGDARVFRDLPERGGENVVHLGYCTDGQLRALYEHAACLAFPSFYEGFGLPPLEAMACGCPVVMSRRASLSEVGGEAVAYCDPDDIDDLREQVVSVLDAPDQAAALRERGRAHAAEFTWERTAQAVLGVLRNA